MQHKMARRRWWVRVEGKSGSVMGITACGELEGFDSTSLGEAEGNLASSGTKRVSSRLCTSI